MRRVASTEYQAAMRYKQVDGWGEGKNRYEFQFCITKAWLLYSGFCGECVIQRMEFESNRENIGRLRFVSICYSFINFWLMHAHDVLTFSFLHLMLCIIESREIYCCCYLHVDEQNTEQHETEATIWSLHLSLCIVSKYYGSYSVSVKYPMQLLLLFFPTAFSLLCCCLFRVECWLWLAERTMKINEFFSSHQGSEGISYVL